MVKVEYIGKCLVVEEKNRRILAIGDLHLGYEEYMNRTGFFVSREMFNETVEYLGKIFDKIGVVEEIVLLGDVKQEFGIIGRQEWDDVLKLFDFLERKCKRIIVVKGNHDVILEPIVKKSCVELKEIYIFRDVCFVHGDKKFENMKDERVQLWVMGHGHPAVKISDGVKIEKYKCFLEGKHKEKKVIIAPSFFEGNEGTDPRENNLGLAWEFKLENFKVKVVQDNSLKVLDFGKLKEIK